MYRNLFFFSTFLITNFYYSQHNQNVKLDYDNLMVEIRNISKTNAQYVKYDSLLNVLYFLNNQIKLKDSTISELTEKVKLLELRSNSKKEEGNYIIIGAFNDITNAKRLLNKFLVNGFQIYNFPSSKFNYVGYKVKSTDSISVLLKYFRQKWVKDAWILQVTE